MMGVNFTVPYLSVSVPCPRCWQFLQKLSECKLSKKVSQFYINKSRKCIHLNDP